MSTTPRVDVLAHMIQAVHSPDAEPDPTTDPMLKSRLTVRMEMFEVL